MMKRRAVLSAILLLVGACTSSVGVQDKQGVQEAALCQSGPVRLYVDFPAARLAKCEPNESGFRLTVLPESEPINPSPWYAFRLAAPEDEKVAITLAYPGYRHRYAPKTSTDMEAWQVVPEGGVIISESGAEAQFTVSVPAASSLYVSGQEVLSVEDYQDWITGLLDGRAYLNQSKLGVSVQGREIVKIEARATSPDPKGTLVLVGRQHPPEVTGAFGLMAFSEEVLGPTELARKFRQEYSVVLVPLLNPDGVELGYWRQNVGHVDLNRDWGPFSQPEIALMRDELARVDASDNVALFLDFHSTWKNVIYTQTDDVETRPSAFAARWLSAMNAEIPEFGMVRQGGNNTNRTTSKSYVYKTYGAAAITFELADDVDRGEARTFSRMAAREMMKILLASAE